ncbi:unnamed protein product [Arabidopsis halleri]
MMACFGNNGRQLDAIKLFVEFLELGLMKTRHFESDVCVGCSLIDMFVKGENSFENAYKVFDKIFVADMHERKAAMAQKLMPSLHSLEEVGLLNVNLLALFDTSFEQGFIKPGARNIVVSAPTAKELMEKLEYDAFIGWIQRACEEFQFFLNAVRDPQIFDVFEYLFKVNQ